MLIDCVFSFDDIWEPSEKDNPDMPGTYDKDPVKIDITKEDVPPALLMKGNETEISRDEESTVMIQLDILRGIHSDLHHVSEEVMDMSSAKSMTLSMEAGRRQSPKKMVKKNHCLMWLTTLREEFLA